MSADNNTKGNKEAKSSSIDNNDKDHNSTEKKSNAKNIPTVRSERHGKERKSGAIFPYRFFREGISLIIPIFLIYTITIILFPGTYSIDEYIHYVISHTALYYPCSFLSPYGKPPFTLISALLILIFGNSGGILTIRIFNTIISSLTIGLTYTYCRMKGFDRLLSTFASLLTAGGECFLRISASALTEPLFGFTLILYLILIEDRKNNAASVLLSIMFIIRPEALIIMAISLFGKIMERRIIDLLKEGIIYALPPVIWTLLLWMCKRPILTLLLYNSVIDEFELKWKIYTIPLLGKGLEASIYYFIKSPEIFGPITLLIFIAGLLDKKGRKINGYVLTIFGVYFIFQTLIFMFPGLGSSGLARYFYAFLPALAPVYASGLQIISRITGRFIEYRDKVKAKENFISVYNDDGNVVYYRKQDRSFPVGRIRRRRVYGSIIILCLIFIQFTWAFRHVMSTNYGDPVLYSLDEDIGTYLTETGKNTGVYTPLLGPAHLLKYMISPEVYFNYEPLTMKDDDIRGEVRSTFYVIRINGYFIDNIRTVNLLEVPNGSVLIWYSIYGNDTILNPSYVDTDIFKPIYKAVHGNYSAIVYEKVA